MYINRDTAIDLFKAHLKAKTGKKWSVRGGRGTGYGWIDIMSMPKQRVSHDSQGNECQPKPGEIGNYLSLADRELLASAFGLQRPVHFQGLSISSDERGYYLFKLGAINTLA